MRITMVRFVVSSLSRVSHGALGVEFRTDASHTELAVVVGRHFESMNIEVEKDEQNCIQAFLKRLEGGRLNEYARSTAIGSRRHRGTAPARPGEQVAAKVTRTDENGSWILASVQRFYPETETYDVQDEDDTTKLIRLPWNHVMRLSMGTEGTFEKDTDCMAIFPETTSFYRAKVSKNPVWEMNSSREYDDFQVTPFVKEVIVKFEDDEDANGRTPHRRVPARYVIPIPKDYFYDELEDVDLGLVDQGGPHTK